MGGPPCPEYGRWGMGWWQRLDQWWESHWLLTAALMGVFLGSFNASLSAFDWIDGLIAGVIWSWASR